MKYSKDVHDHFIREEGLRTVSYLDHLGNYTIGVGHYLGRDKAFKGIKWTTEKCIMVLESDIDTCLKHAKEIFPQFSTLPPNVQLAVLDMIFNLGGYGFRQFKTVIRMIHAQRYQDAAAAALESKWARQVPNRAARTTKLMSNT